MADLARRLVKLEKTAQARNEGPPAANIYMTHTYEEYLELRAKGHNPIGKGPVLVFTGLPEHLEPVVP